VARVAGTLNGLERVLMNNPIRAAIQRHLEARWLLEMGGPVTGGRVLEIGCGRGVGVELIFEVFGAERVDAFDLDVAMVRRAQRRLVHHGGRVHLWIGDATRITADDDAYDAVFDFGILHHVPAWRTAVAEVCRVLKPGGRLYAEEMLAGLILHPVWRRLLDHPLEDRFDCATFKEELERVGFELISCREHHGHAAWFVAQKAEAAGRRV
jgi:ubiquinone/menaquinone biosynthesis C-methylase UbiE